MEPMELEDKDFPRLSELFFIILVAVLLQSELSASRNLPQQRCLLHCFCTFSFIAQWNTNINKPCNELKIEKRYRKARVKGPQAKNAKPQVMPRRKVRLTTLRRFLRISSFRLRFVLFPFLPQICTITTINMATFIKNMIPK